MKDKLTYVTRFMERWNIQLPKKGFEDWREVVAGTYTHKSLPYGPMREGITNGVVGYFVSSTISVPWIKKNHKILPVNGSRCVELHMSNLNVELDKPFIYYSPKKKLDAAKVNQKDTQTKISKKLQQIYDELL